MESSNNNNEKLIVEKKKATGKSVASSSKTKGTTNNTSTTTKKDTSKTKSKTLNSTTSNKTKKSIDMLKKTSTTIEEKDKNLTHVEILQKKIEAQKKLKDEILDDTSTNQSNTSIIKEQIQILKENNENDANIELENEIEKLRNDNEKMRKSLSSLSEELKSRDEKLIVLTNSIASKATEGELIKQIETLKQQNSILKDELEKKVPTTSISETVSTNESTNTNEECLMDSSLVDIREKGDVLLRIKLINERIAEKDAQIKLVEEELSKLSEKDIIAQSFTNQIKELRKTRKDAVNQANYELEGQAELIKVNEEKLQTKKKLFASVTKELEEFDKILRTKRLTYTEKEEQMKIRSRITASKDALYIEVENLEDNYKKLVQRYKARLELAEKRVEKLNKIETDLIELYLKKLRENKSSENEDYQHQKEEREFLLKELNKLYKKLEDDKKEENNTKNYDGEDLDNLKKEYAKVLGKLNLIKLRYEERTTIENALLTHEKAVKEYYDAFKNREVISLNIKENKAKVETLQKKLESITDGENNTIQEKIKSLKIVVEDDEEKIKYYEKIISQYINDEKVIFYMKLIGSMVELKDAEKEYTKKSVSLKELIMKKEITEE